MKKWIRANRGFLLFLVLLGITRTSLADWNHVPTGSMQPTILEGDLVFVNRVAFDLKIPLTHVRVLRLGEPERGDIVTFESPADGTRLVKRLVAVPGDLVRMRNKVLVVNGRAASYELLGEDVVRGLLFLSESNAQETHLIQWEAQTALAANFGPVRIPPDHFLMLGDNRDHSADSRYIGLVPRHLLIGRAERILISADITGNWLPRFERFGQRLN